MNLFSRKKIRISLIIAFIVGLFYLSYSLINGTNESSVNFFRFFKWDNTIKLNRKMMDTMLENPECTTKKYAQFYDDAIVNCILNTLFTKEELDNKVFFEIGAHVIESNFLYFKLQGHTVYRFDAHQKDANTSLFAEEFTRENVISIVDKYYIPKIDILSIDIDSYDYWLLWEMITAGHRPDMIILEINSCLDQDSDYCTPANVYLRKYSYSMTTSSMGTYIRYLAQFGYTAVHLVDTLNIHFLKNKYVVSNEQFHLDYNRYLHCPVNENNVTLIDEAHKLLGCKPHTFFTCEQVAAFKILNDQDYKMPGDHHETFPMFLEKCKAKPAAVLQFSEMDNYFKNPLNLDEETKEQRDT